MEIGRALPRKLPVSPSAGRRYPDLYALGDLGVFYPPWPGTRLAPRFRVDAQYTPAETATILEEIRRVANFYTFITGSGMGFDRGGEIGRKMYGQLVGGPAPTQEDYNFMAAFIQQRPDIFKHQTDWQDALSKAIGYVVQAIVVAGIGYGAYLTAAQVAATAVAPSSAATAAPTGAVSSASTTTVSATGAGTGLVPAGSTVTGGAGIGSQAAGALKTTVGLVNQAKTVMGVASAIKAATSGGGSEVVETLDTSVYGQGSGSGGGAGGTGGESLFSKLTAGPVPLFIGGGILAVLLAVALTSDGKKRKR